MAARKAVLRQDSNIAIINRGEAALRFIRAVRDYNGIYNTRLRTTAFYLDLEQDSYFVQEADLSCALSGLTDRKQEGSLYLDRTVMIKALAEMGCDAVWPGWGFLSEDASFAGLLEERGVVFIGPRARSMELLGDKIAAKALAERSAVPILPWSRGAVASLEEALKQGEALGYPLIIKAANAGGGRGIRFVWEPRQLEGQYRSAVKETKQVTGDELVFMEHLVENGRHLEVQVVADRFGQVETFGVRDCSVQRKNQKIIEETPPPLLSKQIVKRMESAAIKLTRAAGYESAGTVEFLYDMNTKEFYFMEVNTRLQVEHPITEILYNIDLIQEQLKVAFNQRLSRTIPSARGVALEVRLNAEDPENSFAPAPGKITRWEMPGGPGIRVDTGFKKGDAIPPFFDSMLAKIIAYAPGRVEAQARLIRALNEMKIRIEGGTTNKAFLIRLLQTDFLKAGAVSTRFVENLLEKEKPLPAKENWDIAILAAAVERAVLLAEAELKFFKEQLFSLGHPRSLPGSQGHKIYIQALGAIYQCLVTEVGCCLYHVEIDGMILPVRFQWRKNDSRLIFKGKTYGIQTVLRGDRLQCEVNGTPYILEIESGGYVKASSPATVLAVFVRVGAKVAQGDPLLSLEAMKMEMVQEAPLPGEVREILVAEGDQVSAGQALVKVESQKKDRETASVEDRVQFPDQGLLEDIRYHWELTKAKLSALFLGYDTDEDYPALLESLAHFVRVDPRLLASFLELCLSCVDVFIRIESLFSAASIKDVKFPRVIPSRELLSHFFIKGMVEDENLPESFLKKFYRAINLYQQSAFREEADRYRAMFHIYKSHANLDCKQETLKQLLFGWEEFGIPATLKIKAADLLDELALLVLPFSVPLANSALHLRYELIDKHKVVFQRKTRLKNDFSLFHKTARREQRRQWDEVVQEFLQIFPDSLEDLVQAVLNGDREERAAALEILARSFNRDREFISGERVEGAAGQFYRGGIGQGQSLESILAVIKFSELSTAAATLVSLTQKCSVAVELVVLLVEDEEKQCRNGLEQILDRNLNALWCCVGCLSLGKEISFRTFYPDPKSGWREDTVTGMLNPLLYRELKIERLGLFDLDLLYASRAVYLFAGKARDNPKDERLFILADVCEPFPEQGEDSSIIRIPGLELVFMEALNVLRREQLKRKRALFWNRLIIHTRLLLNASLWRVREYARRLAFHTWNLGIENIVLYAKRKKAGRIRDLELIFFDISHGNFSMRIREPKTEALIPMDIYDSRVVQSRQRNTLYPFEIVKMLIRPGAPFNLISRGGDFDEYDIEIKQGRQEIKSVKGRRYGRYQGNVVFGIITNYTPVLPKGFSRVLILTDTTVDMGSLAEAECRRVIAALDLAQRMRIPVEWIPISSGAKIDMESGTENLDWTAGALKRIVEFTQAGGEINIIVYGINVGAQSYWNAEATMLMHTRGLLIMTDEGAMLLTGKKALDFAGSVSAENNLAIGGVEQIMGLNGQAQVHTRTLMDGFRILFQHYSYTYVQPGLVFPGPIKTDDAPERDIGFSPYLDRLGQGFRSIGDIFSRELNPERKKPFEMRQVMEALIDLDGGFFERWQLMKDAETAIVWETRLGGLALGLIGIESKNVVRLGDVPYDGPDSWNGGTLFPLSSKKVARGINSFSGRLPLLVLANLSGFDGSPESMRKLQLEYGAEIGRAVVNFRGPILFVVMARYHGGAYVVFSKHLNPQLKAIALEGSYASVIGGAPAAGVVFSRQVRKETLADPRVLKARQRLENESGFSKRDYEMVFQKAHKEKQAAVAEHFDTIHSVERAKKLCSIDEIITLGEMRPYLIRNLQQAMDQYRAGL